MLFSTDWLAAVSTSWNTTAIPSSLIPRGPRRATDAAVKAELALVWAVHPADDLDERRLARAVFAEQRVHLTGSDLEVRVDERSGRPEALGHVGEREAVAGCCHAVAPH